MSSNGTPRRSMLTRAGTKAAALAVRPEIDNEGINAFGLTALVGYEAEVNHCIGLCTATYSDYHFHMGLASTDTFKYRTRSKHRLIHTCIKGNAKWFNLLWKAGNVEDMINLRCSRYEYKENLVYHLLVHANENRGQQPNQDTLNRLAILRILLASPIDMVVVDRRYGLEGTPRWYWRGSLNLAIYRKNYPLAYELLKYPNRIDPNKPEQFPPIFYAVSCEDFWEIGIELANRPNVNLNVIESYGYFHRSVLQYAVAHNRRAIIERVFLPHHDRIDINYMHEEEDVGTALNVAIYERCNDLIPLLCSFRSIDINIMHPENGSPLHYSLENSNIEAARLLLGCKDRINVNLANNEGETALAIACRKGCLEIVQTLLAFPNIDINTINTYRRTPLQVATNGSSIEIVKLLVQDPSKCNVNVRDENGKTPLHLAILKVGSTEEEEKKEEKQRQYEIVRILAAVPTFNFNLKNNNNNTVIDIAMQIASLSGNQTVVKGLIKYKDRFDESLRRKYNLLISALYNL